MAARKYRPCRLGFRVDAETMLRLSGYAQRVKGCGPSCCRMADKNAAHTGRVPQAAGAAGMTVRQWMKYVTQTQLNVAVSKPASSDGPNIWCVFGGTLNVQRAGHTGHIPRTLPCH